MATPADDDFDDEDAYPRTVLRVPVGFDMLGHPTRWIETDPWPVGSMLLAPSSVADAPDTPRGATRALPQVSRADTGLMCTAICRGESGQLNTRAKSDHHRRSVSRRWTYVYRNKATISR